MCLLTGRKTHSHSHWIHAQREEEEDGERKKEKTGEGEGERERERRERERGGGRSQPISDLYPFLPTAFSFVKWNEGHLPAPSKKAKETKRKERREGREREGRKEGRERWREQSSRHPYWDEESGERKKTAVNAKNEEESEMASQRRGEEV